MTRFLIALNVLAFAIEAASPVSPIDRFALWPLYHANAKRPCFPHLANRDLRCAAYERRASCVRHALLVHVWRGVERVLGAGRTCDSISRASYAAASRSCSRA
ncbi:hypothetical protein BCAR13_90028 [Paraburkholderia caribensis]|nr:hypothetical protein BCAR13_90028 [Paraburkholderia caribensis]